MADYSLDTLLHPPFEANPPVKLNISAKIIGLIACILAALGLLGYLFAIPAILALNALATGLGVVHPGIFAVAIIGLLIGVVADILELIGGYRMYQENHEGKKLLIYGIALGALGSVVYGIGFGGIGGVIVGLVIDFIVYYIVVISRFPGRSAPWSRAAPLHRLPAATAGVVHQVLLQHPAAWLLGGRVAYLIEA